MRILFVEDDRGIASFVIRGLEEEEHEVVHAVSGDEGLHRALTEPHDVAIVDIMLPGIDGLSLVGELRRQGQSLPVLILTARNSEEDRKRASLAGADDYLTKPFAFSELLSRLHDLAQRGEPPDVSRLVLADLIVDLTTGRVERSGHVVVLDRSEFALLGYLLRNAGRVVSKAMIMEHVWDYSLNPGANVVEICIRHLQDKVDQGYDRKLIHEIRGVGYVARVAP